jgi:Ca2+-binding EF-hand superfamily protein
MDTNGNGKLEPSEIPEYRRGFVSMVVSRLGADPNKTIDLADLSRKASTSSGNSATRNDSSTSRQTTGTATDPLVPLFGETEPQQTQVLEFGQREPQPKSVAAASSSSTLPMSQSDQILRSAREIMNKYDKNKNGTLDKDKSEWVSSLSFNADKADRNRDGRISMTELIDTLGGKTGVTTGAATISTKQPAAYERLPPGMPDWFFDRDKDQDGQLTMQEYANGQLWNNSIVEEFEFLDRNKDGVATVAEIFLSLKEFDEKKRLQEEQAKREIERRKGVGSESTPPPTPPTPSGDSPQPATSTPTSSPTTPPTGVSPTTNPATPPGTPPPTNSSEPAPNWRPTSTDSASATIPTTGPYASGSSNSDQRQRSRVYQRSGNSSRNRDR